MRIEKFDSGTIEQISRIIGDMFTGTTIPRILIDAQIECKSANSTKWRIIDDCLTARQLQDNCANNVLNFVKEAFKPSRNINNTNYETSRNSINQILSFVGFEIKQSGEISEVKKSVTIDDAKKRAENLKNKLKTRNTHNDIFVYCGNEIETENYFHIVFEATKGVFDKIRKKTGLVFDGAALVDEVFSFDKTNPCPYLALNSLRTESEQSEQKGFMNLLKGLYGTFKNPLGHEVKINWNVKEEDALDILYDYPQSDLL